MKAKDIMTQRVISVGPDATIYAAARLMLQNHISGLPVVDSAGTLIGIVTEGDFLRRSETGTDRHRPRWLEWVFGPGRAAADYTRSHGRKVHEIMSTDPRTALEETRVDEIVSLMERYRIKRIPVTRNGRLVGIVSRANLVHAMLPFAKSAPAPAQSDLDIRSRITAELERHEWAPIALVEVTVNKGIVDLWGTILDERDRAALKVVAENAPGVKAVRDHLVFVEPISGFVIGPDEPTQTAGGEKAVV